LTQPNKQRNNGGQAVKMMEIVEKAIETQGTIDKEHHLVLDEALPIEGPQRVRVIILVPEEAEVEEHRWLKAAASNEAFSFLKDAEEDIYSLSDGKPFHG
jgi:hypothetical protein